MLFTNYVSLSVREYHWQSNFRKVLVLGGKSACIICENVALTKYKANILSFYSSTIC
jgi:hypothetical protein